MVLTDTPDSAKNDFVTVVSVGSLEEASSHTPSSEDINSGYVTVLKIGDDDDPSAVKTTIEEVLVYRLPGERLGFGLKFEGGTKASEFVKRLFIQSCAPDSPASRVRSSWGLLTEGDEVLEIDSRSVKSMTRIDCVRCLKDSNVVIKLLVKHNSQPKSAKSNKSTEDLPLVIGAEKKRTPPPPPPVPPRKIPRKRDSLRKVPAKGGANQEPANKSAESSRSRHHSPQNNSKKSPPEAVPRDRRLSDGSIGPPDAEVYVDLISQESPYCLSESDDTGSSISTVVDRFNSFPTTTTSSFAGSLPSTPTARQRQIDVSCDLNPFDGKLSETYLFDKLVSLEASEERKEENCHELLLNGGKNGEKSLIQPPVHFQDAPLSYANEDMKNIEEAIKNNNALPNSNKDVSQIEVENNVKNEIHNKVLSSIKTDDIMIIKPVKQRPPPPPPRSKYSATIKETNNNDYEMKNENCSENLPRLVDFVPKSNKASEDVRKSAENEENHNDYHSSEHEENEENQCDENYDGFDWNEDSDFYTNSNWGLSCPLATIGEVEEESSSLQMDVDDKRSTSIFEGFDEKLNDGPDTIIAKEKEHNEVVQRVPEPAPRNKLISSKTTVSDVDVVMETPSINSRLPPDGHEFPDYEESTKSSSVASITADAPTKKLSTISKESANNNNNVRNKIAMFSCNNSNDDSDKDVAAVDGKKGLSKYAKHILNNPDAPDVRTKRKSLDMSATIDTVDATTNNDQQNHRLYMRSQSLIDISSSSAEGKSVSDKWSQLIEQRRKGLSKLKGLVIPEHPDNETTSPVIDLPEIKSSTKPAEEIQPIGSNWKLSENNNPANRSPRSIISYSWSNDAPSMPKYSPAFKRKTLQVYGNKTECTTDAANKTTQLPSKQSVTSQSDELRLQVTLPLNDAPKSLESITSPTRSDCSFEYISSSPELLKSATNKTILSSDNRKSRARTTDFNGRSEDESDNDSAVSSSQSSYISRNSPPASPNFSADRSCNVSESGGLEKSDVLSPRLLKPQSVEAINRKNILASAKCRSGRDLKVGSPLIQRKFDETDETAEDKECKVEETKHETPVETEVEPIKNESKIVTNGTTKVAQKKIVTRADLRKCKTPEKPAKQLSTSRFGRQTEKTSVNDLRKNFEKFSGTKTNKPLAEPLAKSNSKLSQSESVSSIPVLSKYANTSLPSAISTKSSQKPSRDLKDIKEIIKTTTAEWEETLNADLIKVVVLRPDFPGGSAGITLAGGTDYETKYITIHKIRNASLAFRDGQLQKGDRILAINGKSMNGVTHAQSISSLKLALPEIVIVAYSGVDTTPISTPTKSTPFFETPIVTEKESAIIVEPKKRIEYVVKLVKDSASGLGFSVEGGKESPQGDVPLVIKKLFTGGIADKTGLLFTGDELIQINSIDVTNMSRIDAWTLMRKLPLGAVVLKVRR